MLLAFVLSRDKDVIKAHYHETIKFFCQDLIDVALKHSWYINQFKKHDLVLKVAIAGFEGRLLFISFSDPHLMVGIG